MKQSTVIYCHDVPVEIEGYRAIRTWQNVFDSIEKLLPWNFRAYAQDFAEHGIKALLLPEITLSQLVEKFTPPPIEDNNEVDLNSDDFDSD